MSLFKNKTVVYLAAFMLTLATVIATLAIVPTRVVLGAGAGDACKNGGEKKYEQVSQYSNSIDDLVDCYHTTVNNMFNEAIKQMVALGKTGNEAQLNELIERVSPPKADEKGSRSCAADPKNLSTYCLAENLVIEFARFRSGMNVLREKLKGEAGAKATQLQKIYESEQTDQSNIGDSDTMAAQKELFESFGAKINRIDESVQVARTALDQGLAAYNELQFALPLHMKYKKIITGLEDYRDKLSKIRQRVEFYPISFVDVTTASCN